MECERCGYRLANGTECKVSKCVWHQIRLEQIAKNRPTHTALPQDWRDHG